MNNNLSRAVKGFLFGALCLFPAQVLAQGQPLFTAYSQAVAGTVAVANTYQSVLTANSGRKGCVVQNTSANVEFIYVGPIANATAGASINLAAGASFNCTSPGGLVLADQISITSATVSSAFVVVSQ